MSKHEFKQIACDAIAHADPLAADLRGTAGRRLADRLCGEPAHDRVSPGD